MSRSFVLIVADAMGIAVNEVRRRQADAGSAVPALVDDRIAGYGWVLHGLFRIPKLQVEAPLPGNHVYIWDCLRLPRYRGRGIFPALLRRMLDELLGGVGTFTATPTAQATEEEMTVLRTSFCV